MAAPPCHAESIITSLGSLKCMGGLMCLFIYEPDAAPKRQTYKRHPHPQNEWAIVCIATHIILGAAIPNDGPKTTDPIRQTPAAHRMAPTKVCVCGRNMKQPVGDVLAIRLCSGQICTRTRGYSVLLVGLVHECVCFLCHYAS